MKPIFLCVLAALAATAAVVPDQYIVELTGEPAATRLVRQGRRIHGNLSLLQSHRLQVRREQQSVRAAVEQQATVLGSVDTVATALLVQTSAETAEQLAGLPGVKSVRPARQFKMLLDHALLLHKVPDAWSQIGGPDSAGVGVKIGIIDTGIDSAHPAFQDASLTIPDGFPKSDTAANSALTNNKVIVARSYMKYLSSRDPDQTAQDHIGHGTALAMISAGRQVAGPMATIQGVAPKAQLGNYRIFGSAAINGTTSETAILKALDDAVADGMDVINCSFGSDLASRLDDDPEVAAVSRASAAGVIVVVSAGNSGPDYSTVASPATAPDAIAVGASANERVFAASAAVPGLSPWLAVPGDRSADLPSISAPAADVAALDGSGLACASLPAGSLSGRVALILRGSCYFEDKLRNVQAAGAVAGLVYSTDSDPDAGGMATGSVTLPAQMISHSSGLALKQWLASQSDTTITLTFALSPTYTDPNKLAGFSSKGPNVDGSIKPDLVATGTNIYMATQKLDSQGDMYSANGYTTADGTSFSAPLVAGAAAVLKAARPGLTVAQYRSLLVNNTQPLVVDGVTARFQQAGSGVMDVSAALRATATLTPAALSFGAGSGDPRVRQSLTITNVGASPETYVLSIRGRDNTLTPTIDNPAVTLAPGQSQQVAVQFAADNLPAGAYEGMIYIQSLASGVESHVPYWYGVTSSTPAGIGLLDSTASGRAGASLSQAITFHLIDETGLVLRGVTPRVTVVSGGGSVRSISSQDRYYPGMYTVTVRLGAAGANVFRITAGDVTRDVTITAN